MKEYELSILFHPDLEMNLDPALDKVKTLIETSGGEIIKEEPEGKKRLAYPIGKHEFALYYYMNVELPADALDKISSTLNISDEVIRHMIVKADPKRAKYTAAKDAEAAEASEATESAVASTEDKKEREA